MPNQRTVRILAEQLRTGTEMTAPTKWITERLDVGTWTYLNHLLCWKRRGSAVGSDVVSAWVQRDSLLRPGKQVLACLGGTGKHSKLQNDRNGKTAKAVFSFHVSPKVRFTNNLSTL